MALKPGLTSYKRRRGTTASADFPFGSGFQPKLVVDLPSGGTDSRERRGFVPSCSICGGETDLYVNDVPICPACDQVVVDTEARSFAELNEAPLLARKEYCEALAAHEDVRYRCSALAG